MGGGEEGKMEGRKEGRKIKISGKYYICSLKMFISFSKHLIMDVKYLGTTFSIHPSIVQGIVILI